MFEIAISDKHNIIIFSFYNLFWTIFLIVRIIEWHVIMSQIVSWKI